MGVNSGNLIILCLKLSDRTADTVRMTIVFNLVVTLGIQWCILNNDVITFICSIGIVEDIDSMKCAMVSWKLGAGRTKAGDSINHAVGLELTTAVGRRLRKGKVGIAAHLYLASYK